VRAKQRFEQRLLTICASFATDEQAPQRRLCARIQRHLQKLFVFVLEPHVPADNNAAERSLRPLVISRKISGGTRSPKGSRTRMTLASLFGTWAARGLDLPTSYFPRNSEQLLHKWFSTGGLLHWRPPLYHAGNPAESARGAASSVRAGSTSLIDRLSGPRLQRIRPCGRMEW
jgi:hypothetical protein